MTPPDLDSYLLCATPRTGSTLLCGLLASSGVAGRPASYFNRRGLHDYAVTWRIDRPGDDRIDDTYVRAALAAGRTTNGVFGGRIMAESMPELLADLRVGAVGDGAVGDRADLDLLQDQFGRLRFVHLRRSDVVGQAVSWTKAQQTHFWHPDESVQPGGEDPHYDEELIAQKVSSIEVYEAFWSSWFAAQGIEPHEVEYADLSADPVGTAQGVLDFLGLELPAGHELVVGHRRQADEVNADWSARFHAR